LAANAANIVTAGLRPELFDEFFGRKIKRAWLIAVLAFLIVAGFGFRAASLSAEGLSEDELNKLNAVTDYRAHGLSAANGEHPFLMKALLATSIIAAEKWNASALAAARPAALRISTETSLRLPATIFGACTALLIYLLTAELFGIEAALIAAALWAFDPNAIGFNRIAKEDTFLLFFFLLANVFWVRGQSIAEGESQKNPEPYYWAAAASYGAMLASKYVPQFLVIGLAYNYVFQEMPSTRWRIGKKRFLIFILVMGAAFLLFNPTILLPGTWKEMLAFAGGKRIGHDSYEFMGALYHHSMVLWLKGVPWYFYFVYVAVKLPLFALACFIAGFPLLFRRKLLGDGRYFLLFWMFYWALTFVFSGGKFTRYFTTILPAVLITATLGAQFISHLLARHVFARFEAKEAKNVLRAVIMLMLILCSVQASSSIAPHYRMYLNWIGGGEKRAGDYFPHDEFYDASLRDAVSGIAQRARQGARVASETPGLAAYYAQQMNRDDLICVSLSDASALKEFGAGDFVIAERGRRYFSNDKLLSALRESSAPAFRLSLGRVLSAEIYMLDQASAALLNNQ
jgi:predicted membrane-bound dolichyl-phosphate-mannose-protein mannosyltransferase